MLSLDDQIRLRKLACPATRQPLLREPSREDRLVTPDRQLSYPLVAGVPILLADPEVAAGYLAEQAGSMVAEYTQLRRSLLRSVADRLTAAVGDQRTADSEQAFRAALADLPEDALCVSVGGGPLRIDPRLVNLNIGAFPNVDVVADAYRLPYADGAVDAFHCEAVLEHLEEPQRAVAEMYRALCPGRLVYAATPFLQVFHGYPSHFQNFTLIGHRRLFEREGFTVLQAGVCVGPAFALRDLTLNAIRTALPGGRLGRILSRLLALPTLPLLWLDRLTRKNPAAHVLASTTYLLARKPAAAAGPNPDARPRARRVGARRRGGEAGRMSSGSGAGGLPCWCRACVAGIGTPPLDLLFSRVYGHSSTSEPDHHPS
ncbi:MAG TPA: methyltransferase domain-containing protein [Thermoanaerobaculia bacterium]|jgi:uncharacterized protein YbaR (Trm112 family)/SAM-dependent methyltransferase|nr:methyltransferase domain-containing protein [Thermoanaerobaculia bacterium]